MGYQIRKEKTTVVFKAGNLASAFGAFPLHYDDADNALIDQPFSYIQYLSLRNDQLPCGVTICCGRTTFTVLNHCGGPPGGDEGLTPVNLYGMPGVQAEVSSHRVDARIQVASGSPSSPLSLSHAAQYAQWVTGGGYTIRQGWRVGVSGFRGPYLTPDVAAALPLGTSVREFSGQRPGSGGSMGAWALERQRRMAALPVRFPGIHAGAVGYLHLRRSQADSDAAIVCSRPCGLVQAGRGNGCELARPPVSFRRGIGPMN